MNSSKTAFQGEYTGCGDIVRIPHPGVPCDCGLSYLADTTAPALEHVLFVLLLLVCLNLLGKHGVEDLADQLGGGDLIWSLGLLLLLGLSVDATPLGAPAGTGEDGWEGREDGWRWKGRMTERIGGTEEWRLLGAGREGSEKRREELGGVAGEGSVTSFPG